MSSSTAFILRSSSSNSTDLCSSTCSVFKYELIKTSMSCYFKITQHVSSELYFSRIHTIHISYQVIQCQSTNILATDILSINKYPFNKYSFNKYNVNTCSFKTYFQSSDSNNRSINTNTFNK